MKKFIAFTHPNCICMLSFFSVSQDNSHPKEKAGQKPKVKTTHSAQLLSMVTELNISGLYGSKDCTFCQGSHSHDSNCEKLVTLLETARETVLRYSVSCQDGVPGPV